MRRTEVKTFKIWYMKPEFFRFGIMGTKTADPAHIEETHVHLKDIEASDLDDVFHQMQGEVWSPNGEARQMILQKGLRHTSMSVGDVAVDDLGTTWTVSPVGWTKLAKNRSPGVFYS